MSEEKTLFDSMGVRYEEREGLFYPVIAEMEIQEQIHVGKYGHLWMNFMKENHTDRYRHLLRFRKLMTKAIEIDEEAYQLMDSITEKYLKSHSPKDSSSTMEMWRLREEAKRIAEEVIFQDIVNQFH
ncbi:MAG: TnpV protein [Lachnotalea sp.]